LLEPQTPASDDRPLAVTAADGDASSERMCHEIRER
jgi:hypothetical protein